MERRIKLIISLYTDGDWWFKSKDGLIDYNNHRIEEYQYFFADELFSFEGKLYIGSYCTNEYAMAFAPTPERPYINLEATEFLEQLKKDLTFSSHEWIRERFDAMIDGAIDFLEKGETGIYHGSLIDGNWQPTDVFVVSEELE